MAALCWKLYHPKEVTSFSLVTGHKGTVWKDAGVEGEGNAGYSRNEEKGRNTETVISLSILKGLHACNC